MHAKLAGHLSLHDMIKSVIDDARVKVASDEGDEKKDEKKDKKPNPFMKKKEEKGEKEEGEEKKASAELNPSDPDDIEKLASALEFMGEKLADSKYTGGESHQGGEVLVTMSPVAGKQPYKKDTSKSHSVPMSTGLQTDPSQGKASTQVPNDHAKAPGGAPYPKKGVMKTAAEGVMAKIEAMKGKKDGDKDKDDKKAPPFAKKDDGDKDDKEEKSDEKEKKSAALEFVLSKLGEGEVERRMGGETLDSKSGDGPKPSKDSKGGNSVRSHIGSNQAAINMKKVEGKGPQKKMLSEVLTEPALSKAHDSKVSENLRNATKGGVKIAAAKDFLQKIAGDPNDPRHEKLKEAMKKKLEKKSMGGMSMGGGAPAMTTPPPMMGR